MEWAGHIKQSGWRNGNTVCRPQSAEKIHAQSVILHYVRNSEWSGRGIENSPAGGTVILFVALNRQKQILNIVFLVIDCLQKNTFCKFHTNLKLGMYLEHNK